MKKENVFKKELGKYVNIRSSESAEMMICWNTPEYDADCGRWFESNGCSYYCDEHAKNMQNADSLDMLQMRRRHPELSVKETFCEITYLKGKQRAEVYVVCNEYKKGRMRTFTIVLDDANEKETEAMIDAICTWHKRDELHFGRLSIYDCRGKMAK